MEFMSVENTRTARIEWPTIGLICVAYGAVAGLVWFHAVLPWWLILVVGSYFAALHTSLQHEVLHGHPTRHRLLNEAFVFPSLTFWLPFARYRDLHLAHHRDVDLTDPVRDPESYYMLPDQWAAAGPVKRTLQSINNTLGGRMLIGPAVSIIQFWTSEMRTMAKGNHAVTAAWIWFAAAACITITYVVVIAGMPLWKYVLLIAYPGISLALVRSYCEHQAAESVDHRTIIVEASPFWSLLFLHNNLHVAHHSRPALPWYKLPAYYREQKLVLLAKNNGYIMKGYGEIFRRFFLTAKEPVSHPNLDWLRKGDDG
jgi:fatty acid desaturase